MATKTARTLIVLGSGGHTMEMLEIVKNLNKQSYKQRYYILSKTDKTSRDKVLQQVESNSPEDSYSFVEILRSRHVNQSYITSIFTTILAILFCIPIIWRIKPNLILCNGPGTCVPIAFIGYLLRLVRIIPGCKIVFIESFCRVKTISLTGRILQYFVDLFVVQWPELLKVNRNIRYYGRLI